MPSSVLHVHKYAPRTNAAGHAWVLEDTLVNIDPMAAGQLAFGSVNNAETQLQLTRGILRSWTALFGMTPLVLYNLMRDRKPKRLRPAEELGTIEIGPNQRSIRVASPLVIKYVTPSTPESVMPVEPEEPAVPEVAVFQLSERPPVEVPPSPTRDQLLVENQRLREQLRQMAALL